MSKRFLIIRIDRIGDVVLSTPVLKSLRKSFPDSFIAFMVQPYTKDILLNNKYLDEIITYEKDKSIFYYSNLLRKYKFDYAFLLLPDKKLAMILLLAGIKHRITVGWKPYQALTFMKMVSRNKYNPLRHEADYCLDLARVVGLKYEDLTPEIHLTNEEIKLSHNLLPKKEDEIIFGINPTSGKSAPNWRIENYITLTKLLLNKYSNIRILFNSEGIENISNNFNIKELERIIFIKELKLRELILYISRLDLLISASTGPMHIASALKIPTLSLFCPLTACSPKLWGPLGNESQIILPAENYCSTQCPGDPHICTFEGGILIDDVLNKIEKFSFYNKLKS